MKIISVNQNIENAKQKYSKRHFKSNSKSFWKSDYTTGQKLIVAGTTALGVATSLAVLAKFQGYSMKPKQVFDYYKKTNFLFKEVAAIGVGTVAGGLAGGYLIDKNPRNRKAKRREAVMQLGNIIIPIGTVAATKNLCDKANMKGTAGNIIRTGASLAAIAGGIYLANFTMNKLSNFVFKNKTEERDIKATDMFPHIDDALASAQYLAPKSTFVHKIARIVPFALMVAGNEVGNTKAN